MQFPAKITSSCIWVAIPVGWCYFTLVYLWCGRTVGRVYGHVITKISRMGKLPNFLTHRAPLRARASPLWIDGSFVDCKSSETEVARNRNDYRPRRLAGSKEGTILTTDTIFISSQNGFGDQINKTTTTSLIIKWVSLPILFLSIVAFVLLVTGTIFVFPAFKLKLRFKISLVSSTFFFNYAHNNILSL